MSSITRLGAEEQLVLIIEGGTGKKVINGPTTTVINPFQTREWRTATRLSPQQYAVVKQVRLGTSRHDSGPTLLFLGAWDELVSVRPKIVLQAREYMRFIDSYSGLLRVEVGPQRLVPGIFEQAPEGIQRATLITSRNSVVVLNRTSGRKHCVQGDNVGFFTPGPFEEVVEIRNATVLKQRDYAIVRSTLNGEYRHEEGAKLLFIGAYDRVV
jgi:hypothetical protein